MSEPVEHPASKLLRQSLEMVGDDRTQCFEELGRAQARIKALEAENKALRDGLRNAEAVLFKARAYRGYEGGPLAEPFAEMAERHARALLAGEAK